MADASDKSTNHYSPPAWQTKPYGKKETFGTFMWNSETSEFMGRTAESWFKITLFYIVFFSGLALFFMTSMFIFLTTIEDEVPRWILEDSLIGTNPGVGFRPMPDSDKNVDSSLIWINLKKERSHSYWTEQLNEFVEGYRDDMNMTEECSFGKGKMNETTPCRVNVDKMLACNETMNGFGYYSVKGKGKDKVSPCVVIKLNKIYGWTPKPYLTQEDLDKADKMPKKLYAYVQKLIATGQTNKLNTIWISCEGENPADMEGLGEYKIFSPGNMAGEFPGIPGYYYPYEKQPGYMAPFVFVQFQNPAHHALINIRCKAWAKNIKPDTVARQGLVHFEFLID